MTTNFRRISIPALDVLLQSHRRNGFSYYASGNLTNDLGQTFTYGATGQQATASYGGYSLQQSYDGNGLRVKKYDNGATTYYLRSSLLGGQVVAEIQLAPTGGGVLAREYVYLGGQLLAVRSPTKGSLKTYWVHEDPITKSKRVTNIVGGVVSTIETDPWGADTPRSNNVAFQPKKFTSYERDGNASDEAMFRRYNRWHSRFDQPDPYDGGYDAADPQSFNRYSYIQNDPVNSVDPSGLMPCQPGNYSAECDSSGFGGWGGGWNFNDRGHPGRDIVDDGFDSDVRQVRFIWDKALCEVTKGEFGCGIVTTPGLRLLSGNGFLGSQLITICPPVQFKVTGIAPGQAPGKTAISQQQRADIPDGGVAIKPGNFGATGINEKNRSVFLNMRFIVDWNTAKPAGAPRGIPTEGPFHPVDNIGPASVRNSPGNMIDVYNYKSMGDALTSTRTVTVTTIIPANSEGVTCPNGN